MILLLLILNFVFEPAICGHFCQTSNKRIDNIWMIGDYVLIVSNDNKFWTYDMNKNDFLDDQLSLKTLFNGDFESVLYVSSVTNLPSDVINTEYNRKLLNLVIAIGLLDRSKTLGFMTYRYHQKPLSLLKIQNLNELPDNWGLKANGELTNGFDFGEFWPKNVFTDEINSERIGSQIKSFNYFSPKHIFLMNSHLYTDGSNLYSAKYIKSDGQLTDWIPIGLPMNSKQWNDNCLKLFEYKERLFSFCQINGKTLIESEVIFTQNNGVLNLSVKPMNVTIDHFFKCEFEVKSRGILDWFRRKTTPQNNTEDRIGSTIDYSNYTEDSRPTNEGSITSSQSLKSSHKMTNATKSSTTEKERDESTTLERANSTGTTHISKPSIEEEIPMIVEIVLIYLILIHLTAFMITFIVHSVLFWDIEENKELTKIYKQYFRTELNLESKVFPKSFKLKKIKLENKQK